MTLTSNIPYVDLTHPQITVVEEVELLLRAEFTQSSNVIIYPCPVLTTGFNELARLIQANALDGAPDKALSIDLTDTDQRYKLKNYSSMSRNPAVSSAISRIFKDADKLQSFYGAVNLRMMGQNFEESEINNFHIDDLHERILVGYTDPCTLAVYDTDIESMDLKNGIVVIKPGAIPFTFMAGDVVKFTGRYHPDGLCPFAHAAPASDVPRLLMVTN